MGVYVMETFTDYLRAVTLAKEQGMSLCGTFVNDAPVYFLMPPDAEDTVIRDTAFEIREGRPPSSYEKFLLETAEKLKNRAAV